ncbi:SelB C-terminal domain-containing protein [Sediminibacillus massiliensis]
MGKLVLFDRNIIEENDNEVLCQIRLDNEIVARRGDRFILRRPTPAETIGGGWVIEPKGEKYRFGNETISFLQRKKEGTPDDLVEEVLNEQMIADKKQLIQSTSLDEQVLVPLLESGVAESKYLQVDDKFALTATYSRLAEELKNEISAFHQAHPLRQGKNKAEILQSFKSAYPREFIEFTLEELIEQNELKSMDQFLAVADFQEHLPKKWAKRMEEVIDRLQQDGVSVQKWDAYVANTPFSNEEAADLRKYLLATKKAYILTDEMIVHKQSFDKAAGKLKQETEATFDLKQAKDILQLSRKYLIPFLELLDQFKLTEREGSERTWTDLH